MTDDFSVLTSLCAICHIQPPKYRCPRCSTRTCSLPCTRRHKLWSECSGIRDPAAYRRRNDLATESAFDQDFNFITGIERRIERAGREAENRGVEVDGKFVGELGVVGLDNEDIKEDVGAGLKRKMGGRNNGGGGSGGGGGEGQGRRPNAGLARGEAGFLRRAQEAGVKVIKAPKGMSRGKMNGSKWHPRQKCLHWTIEWVTDDGKKRLNCAETCTIAEAYDRAFPLPKEERQARVEETVQPQEDTQENDQVEDTAQPETQAAASAQQPTTTLLPNSPPATEQPTNQPTLSTLESSDEIPSHRSHLFYIHRPRTATKLPVVSLISPTTTISNALHNRTVLEFPTIYVIPMQNAPGQGRGQDPVGESKFILEAEYLRTHPDTGTEVETEDTLEQETLEAQANFGSGPVDIANVDEGKVLEVLEKDLLAMPEAERL